MVRSVGTYFSGSITGTDNVTDLRQKIEDEMQAFLSAGTAAWETYDTLDATAGSKDVVYRSLGDRGLVSGAGDAVLYIEIDHVAATTIDFRAFQDWSTNSSTGSRSSGTTQSQWFSLSATTDITYFGVVNEYEFTMVALQGANSYYCSFGSPNRQHIPPAHQAIAFTTSAVTTTGSNVVIPTDRSMASNTEVGQFVWIYDITQTGDVLESDTVEVLPVQAVSSTDITLNITNNHALGAIIGLDPCPMYAMASVNTGDPFLYWTNNSTGAYVGSGSQFGTFEPFFTSGFAIAETNLDPMGTGLYGGCKSWVWDSLGGLAVQRGIPDHITWWGQGSQADNATDRMIDNFDSTKKYKYFFNLLNSSLGLGIGPGA